MSSLSGGSGFAGGKARIYKYWQSSHSTQDKANFLKDEYGTGGHSHALSGASGSSEDHDFKGIKYSKQGCDKVQLSWTQVATRVDNLVKLGRYFDKEALERYQQEKQAVQKNQGVFDAYNEIKESHPDDIVLYQVGDFFEMYGEDARIAAQKLEINLTTRSIPNFGRVEMCGIPSHTLEQYTELLRESYGVTISAIAEGETERKTYTLPSVDHELEELEQNSEEDSPFVQQVMRDAEAIASEQESYERFSVIETEGGYAVWDDIRDEIYVDEQGVSEEFPSEWQANDYLQEVKKTVSSKESAEWMYNERSKFEATQESAYKVGDTVFLEGEAYNITDIGTSDVQLLPQGMVYPIYRAESKENFERLLRQDERNARFVSGAEPVKTSTV